MLSNTQITNILKNDNEVALKIYFPAPIIFSLAAGTRISTCLTHKDAFDWYYSNFILLSFDNGFVNDIENWSLRDHFLTLYPLDYFFIGRQEPGLFLKETILNQDILDLNSNSIINSVINWLDKEHYVFAHVDVSKLSSTRYYNHHPLVHTCFIYGYNKIKKCFYQLDFISNGQLSKIETSFNDFEKAFYSSNVPELLKQKGMGPEFYISLGKVQHDITYTFNIENVILQISDFINSKNTHIRHQDFFPVRNGSFGLEAYIKLIEYVSIVSKKKFYMPYQGFHALYEHKIIMRDRLRYYRYKGIIRCDIDHIYNPIIKNAEKLRFMALKYYQTRNTKICERMLPIIESISCMEKDALNTLLTTLL